jgi:hypothetical protein
MEKFLGRVMCFLSVVVLLLATFCMTAGFVEKAVGAWGYSCSGVQVSNCAGTVSGGCVIMGITYDCKLNGSPVLSCLYTGGWCESCNDNVNSCSGICVDASGNPVVHPNSQCSRINAITGCRP